METKKIPTRNGFGEAIVELGKANRDILVVDIDIGKSCKTGDFRKQLPRQYLNVGIAEQNGAGVAAGLATCGKICVFELRPRRRRIVNAMRTHVVFIAVIFADPQNVSRIICVAVRHHLPTVD